MEKKRRTYSAKKEQANGNKILAVMGTIVGLILIFFIAFLISLNLFNSSGDIPEESMTPPPSISDASPTPTPVNGSPSPTPVDTEEPEDDENEEGRDPPDLSNGIA